MVEVLAISGIILSVIALVTRIINHIYVNFACDYEDDTDIEDTAGKIQVIQSKEGALEIKFFGMGNMAVEIKQDNIQEKTYMIPPESSLSLCQGSVEIK